MPSLIDDERFRTAVAQEVQRARGNVWLAADYILLGPVAALVAQARADGAAEERKKIARQLVLRGRQWHGDAALMAEELATQYYPGGDTDR